RTNMIRPCVAVYRNHSSRATFGPGRAKEARRNPAPPAGFMLDERAQLDTKKPQLPPKRLGLFSSAVMTILAACAAPLNFASPLSPSAFLTVPTGYMK